MSVFFGIAAVVCILVYLYLRQRKRAYVNAIRSGEVEVLMKWSYSPEDWDWYGGDPSSRWIKHRNIPGEVFITRESIYVTNGRDDYLFRFGEDRKITQCTFYHSFLDLRAEWMIDPEGRDLFEYQQERATFRHEDFRLYVPNDQKEAGLKLAAEYKALAVANAGFSQKYVDGDEIISLFESNDFPSSEKYVEDNEIISLFGNDDSKSSK